MLHPTIRGPLSHHLTRLVWRLARVVALASTTNSLDRAREFFEAIGPFTVYKSFTAAD